MKVEVDRLVLTTFGPLWVMMAEVEVPEVPVEVVLWVKKSKVQKRVQNGSLLRLQWSVKTRSIELSL